LIVIKTRDFHESFKLNKYTTKKTFLVISLEEWYTLLKKEDFV